MRLCVCVVCARVYDGETKRVFVYVYVRASCMCVHARLFPPSLVWTWCACACVKTFVLCARAVGVHSCMFGYCCACS